MEYKSPEVLIERFETVDIMSASSENPTVEQGTDPYVADKF